MKKKIICLIPARGGSKRIKNKNIKSFLGVPLIRLVIKNAKKSKIFNKIYVSTDSVKIKKIAEKSGAIVPFLRSKKLSNDYATIKTVIDDFIIKQNLNILKNQLSIFVIYPTSVFINTETLKKCKKLLQSSEYVTIVKKFQHPIERALKFKNNSLVPINQKKMNMRTQDLKQYFYNSGQIDCIKLGPWLKKNSFFKMKTKYLIFNDINSIDIDTPEDFKLAKILYKKNKKN